MKLTSVNSKDGPNVAGGYSQAVEIQYGERVLFISGQIPESSSGDVPADFKGQACLAWSNVCA